MLDNVTQAQVGQDAERTRQARESVIEDFRHSLAQLQAARAGLGNVLLGQGFVVEIGELTVRFTVENGVATDPTPCPPHQATRFCREDAERLAAACRNGHDEPGRAVHVREAIERAISTVSGLLARFEAEA
jgi:hypothetical protein